MFRQKLHRSSVSFLLCVLTIWVSSGVVHAASVSASAIPQKTFSLIGGGTISGSVIPVTDPGVAKTANALSFQTSIDTLIPANVNYFEVVGQKVKNELYRYPYTLGLTAQGSALEAIELSIDLQAHTQLIAVGTPTAQALLYHNGTSAQQSAQHHNPSGNTSGSSSAVPLSSGTHSVNFTIAWYDPLGIEVNALTDYLTFSYNGSTTTFVSGSDSRWWLSNDGWVEQSHGIYGWNYWGGNVRTYVYTDDIFANTPFCAGQTTDVYDTQNTAEGMNNGNVLGFIDDTYAAGGCWLLLHYNTWLN